MARLASEAYQQVRGRILSGELRDGERLGEEELAEALGISRTPVREALRMLAAEGLVELLPNRGARVPRWDEDDVNDIFDLRALLESHAAGRAARASDDELVPRLESLCERMEDVNAKMGDVEDLAQLASINREFHAAVVAGASSPRLSALVASLVHVPVIMQTFKNYSQAALDRSLRHHREVVDAIRVHDGDWASSVMRAHVLAARHQVVCPPVGRLASVDAGLEALRP